MSKRKKTLIITCVLLILLIVIIAWGNKAIEINTYQISSKKISDNFDSFRIAQISDLHNAEIGEDNKKLVSKLKSTNPDIIVITGDLIDSRTPDVDTAIGFVEEAVKIAPCYYVNGNHEARVMTEYEDLKTKLSELGVYILENKKMEIEKGSETINIAGINDPVFYADIVRPQLTEASIEHVKGNNENFTILLSHRPEMFDLYAEYDFDLVFSGHAHGGQFRLPFIGGLYAPHQGAFPQFDSGLYTKNDTNMILSRGIGNSLFPFRINNRPEIILVELKSS